MGYILPNFSHNFLPNLRKDKNFKVSKAAVKSIFCSLPPFWYFRFEKCTKYSFLLILCAFFEWLIIEMPCIVVGNAVYYI